MTGHDWIAVAFWVAAVVVQVAAGLFNGRVTRVIERLADVEKVQGQIREKASDDANHWQDFIGDITVRLARVEERLRMRRTGDT